MKDVSELSQLPSFFRWFNSSYQHQKSHNERWENSEHLIYIFDCTAKGKFCRFVVSFSCECSKIPKSAGLVRTTLCDLYFGRSVLGRLSKKKSLKSLSKVYQKSLKSLSKVYQKSIKSLSKVSQSLSKVSQKSIKIFSEVAGIKSLSLTD